MSKKPPRTVHIDVYCTGSDVDSSSSSDNTSSEAEDEEYVEKENNNDENLIDQTSNSTKQTVYETEEMKLHHRRAGRNDLPRRLRSQKIGLYCLNKN